MRNFIIFAIISMFLGSCGVSFKEEPTDAEKAAAEKAAADEKAKTDLANYTYVKGYISSAFDLTVDDAKYADSEDFYTQQLDRLQEEAVVAGYDGWALKFDAEIGLVDLKSGMQVFVVATTKTGYAGETKVLQNGTFSVHFPTDGNESRYKIRAVKRINVELTNPDTKAEVKKVKWCYNFSANEQDVTIDEQQHPIILDTFYTRITKYACSVVSGGGIAIPTNPTAPVADAAPAASADVR